MDADLVADAEFLSLVKDRVMAEQAYLMFVNRTWRPLQGGEAVSMSWRYAAGMVATARAMGEEYTDYYLPYCWGRIETDPADEAVFATLFERLGWVEEPFPVEETQQA